MLDLHREYYGRALRSGLRHLHRNKRRRAGFDDFGPDRVCLKLGAKVVPLLLLFRSQFMFRGAGKKCRARNGVWGKDDREFVGARRLVERDEVSFISTIRGKSEIQSAARLVGFQT